MFHLLMWTRGRLYIRWHILIWKLSIWFLNEDTIGREEFTELCLSVQFVGVSKFDAFLSFNNLSSAFPYLNIWYRGIVINLVVTENKMMFRTYEDSSSEEHDEWATPTPGQTTPVAERSQQRRHEEAHKGRQSPHEGHETMLHADLQKRRRNESRLGGVREFYTHDGRRNADQLHKFLLPKKSLMRNLLHNHL